MLIFFVSSKRNYHREFSNGQLCELGEQSDDATVKKGSVPGLEFNFPISYGCMPDSTWL